jgi:hypothetical protein
MEPAMAAMPAPSKRTIFQMPRPSRAGYAIVFAALFALLSIQFGHTGHSHDTDTVSVTAADCLLCKQGAAPAPALSSPLRPQFDLGLRGPFDTTVPSLARVWSTQSARAPPLSAQS